jgi:dipeptidyl aminopeptidase/acylaminoacyl peptidase
MDPSPLPGVAEKPAREITLTGARLNPASNSLSSATTFTSLVFQPIRGDVRRIVLPWQSHAAYAMWSPDGQAIAFTLIEDTGVSLWVAEASSGDIRLLLGPVLNGAFGNPCQWLPSGTGLVCSRVPADRAAPPAGDGEGLFEHYFTGQVILVPLDGAIRSVGVPGAHSSVRASPDGNYLVVETVRRPASPKVPWELAGSRVEIWDLGGAVVRQVADLPPAEGAPSSADGVRPGPRSVGWRADAPATLFWFEALDGGSSAARRDRLLMLEAPFTGEPAGVADLMYWGRGALWARNDLAIVMEEWPRARKSRTWAINPARPGSAPRLLFDWSTGGCCADSGRFLTAPGVAGEAKLLTSKDGRYGFLAGAGASPRGDQPFLDRVELGTARRTRVFRAEPSSHEEAIALLDREAGRLITRRAQPGAPPNYFVRDLRKRPPAQLTQITQFTNPAP